MLRRSCPAKDKYHRLSKKLMSKRVKEKNVSLEKTTDLTCILPSFHFIWFSWTWQAVGVENRNSTCV